MHARREADRLTARSLRRIRPSRTLVDVDVVVDDAARMLASVEPRLRRAFVARYGWPDGLDVAADVMEWAWTHRARLADIDNPAGYLWRVGTSRSRRLRR